MNNAWIARNEFGNFCITIDGKDENKVWITASSETAVPYVQFWSEADADWQESVAPFGDLTDALVWAMAFLK